MFLVITIWVLIYSGLFIVPKSELLNKLEIAILLIIVLTIPIIIHLFPGGVTSVPLANNILVATIIVLTAVLAIIGLFIAYFISFRTWPGVMAFLTIFSLVGSALSFLVIKIARSYKNRAFVIIIEHISLSGHGFTREDIKNILIKESHFYSIFPFIYVDVLSELLKITDITISGGKYYISKKE